MCRQENREETGLLISSNNLAHGMIFMKTVSLQNKRTSFGEDAAAYQSARPPYPATIYDQAPSDQARRPARKEASA